MTDADDRADIWKATIMNSIDKVHINIVEWKVISTELNKKETFLNIVNGNVQKRGGRNRAEFFFNVTYLTWKLRNEKQN